VEDVFENRKARILCVNKSSEGRAALMDAVKSVGFTNLDSCGSAAEVLKRLEVDTYDWIILPLDKGQGVNAIHVMDIVSRSAFHMGVKFSLLLEPDEVFVLPLGFELGLLSWHPATFTRASIVPEIEALMARISAYKGVVALVAAETLREVLMRENKNAELKTFLEALFQVFSHEPTVLAWLAEAEYLNGDRESARKAIAVLKAWGSPLWENLATKYLGNSQELLPDIGLRDVVVVDPDEAVLKSVSELLTKCGVSGIRTFVDGQSAYDAVSQALPDLVIHEWKVPKLSGPNFIQRIRQDGHHNVPMVVLSSLVGKQDILLLQEMSIAHVIEKPFREDDVMNNLVWVVQQEKFPTQQRSLERRMQQEIVVGNLNKAQAFRKQLEDNAAYPEARRVYNAALFAFYANDFEAARNGFLKAIQLGADFLSSINMLGKCFLKMRNFKDAIACFEKAAALSPKNLERMCALAESHSGLGDAEAAKLAVKAAENLDAGNKAVQHTAAKVEIEVGEVRKAAKLFAGLGSLPTLVADMNNTAVAMIRMKDFQGGIRLYEKTLEALPAKETGLKIKVTYNMALAYVRYGELQEAEELLKTIPENFISSVMGKVRRLQKKVRSAILQDRDVSLDSGDDEAVSQKREVESARPPKAAVGPSADKEVETKAEPTSEELLQRTQDHVVAARAGDRCCHMIFHCPCALNTKAKQLLANPPPFKMREAVKKDEGFGVELAAKNS
jgi:CheY-like chemotaxis protein